MNACHRLSHEAYLAFEESIAGKPLGRAFLRQRDEQAHAVALSEMRCMLEELLQRSQKEQADQQNSETTRILYQELKEMSGYIQQTQREIAALRPDESGKTRILSATSELDAIVSSTERATSEILKGAEAIQLAVSRLAIDPLLGIESAETISNEISRHALDIMMACSFQDITGQRTAKVVNTLRYLERRVNAMIEIWGPDLFRPIQDDTPDARSDACLLNGPSLEGGVCQDDVDAMFAEVASDPSQAT